MGLKGGPKIGHNSSQHEPLRKKWMWAKGNVLGTLPKKMIAWAESSEEKVQRDYIAPPASKRCTKINSILQSCPMSYFPLITAIPSLQAPRGPEKDTIERMKPPLLPLDILRLLSEGCEPCNRQHLAFLALTMTNDREMILRSANPASHPPTLSPIRCRLRLSLQSSAHTNFSYLRGPRGTQCSRIQSAVRAM